MIRARAMAVALLVSLIGAGSAIAGDGSGAGRTPRPNPPKAQGEACVRDTDVMRRNHMTLLMHQRDDTVHRGVRTKNPGTKDLSLSGCIGCHAAPGADGRPVSYADPGHFCRACHSYAAVSIDCFECHASRPAPAKTASGSDGTMPDLARDMAKDLSAYLDQGRDQTREDGR
ncbi:sulfur reduction protein DsrJ [Blastochloris sulfoviridis]|uniref:Sulfur reduction protein DsrJ n=1 Tax=Blastochloris sulfoviridis TaxID=50712 RepID=A0A5M6I2I2_9HYPH|nr:sulfur reduction protein DsrJ [Blastochloris sulfoviridis]KAA5602416.1 sulfur reduction protein DsrJ [Blastochloris sulfoviridis]